MTKLVKVLAILVLLFSLPASASVGAWKQQLLDVASQSYLNGSLELSTTQQQELDCLAKVTFFEARGESKLGKTMVANVVRNRTEFGKPFATTICKVVYQPRQFAWTKDKKKNNTNFKQIAKKHMKLEKKAVIESLSIAFDQLLFKPDVETTATHFCSIGDKCNFKRVEVLEKVGRHTFFKYLGNM